MVCQTQSYTGGDERGFAWRNWNGSVTNTVRMITPTTLQELVLKIAEASDEGGEVHALGSGWAFTGDASGRSPRRAPRRAAQTYAVTSNSSSSTPSGGLEIGAVNELHADRGRCGSSSPTAPSPAGCSTGPTRSHPAGQRAGGCGAPPAPAHAARCPRISQRN